MKKYLLTVLLVLGLLGMTDLSAQHYYDPRADRKERKMEKKELKIRRKMFRDHGFKAAKKEDKSRKKEYKMGLKEMPTRE
jgi:predicted RNA-binding protein with PUA-like domain